MPDVLLSLKFPVAGETLAKLLDPVTEIAAEDAIVQAAIETAEAAVENYKRGVVAQRQIAEPV